MILTKTVPITISRSQAHYRALGYSPCNYGDTIEVAVEHLQASSNKLMKCKCDKCGDLFDRKYFQLARTDRLLAGKHYCLWCAREFAGKCNGVAWGLRGTARRLSPSKGMPSGPDHFRWNPNRKPFERYSNRVYALTYKNYKYNKDKINPDNLPLVKCGAESGYQIDHKITISWAFKWGINYVWIAAVENLQMLTWQENLRKRNWSVV